MATMEAPYRVHHEDPAAVSQLGAALYRVLQPLGVPERPVVCLCIGTDRSTGDALGPLVGRLLQPWACPGLQVVGSLDEPVHASNLMDTLQAIEAAQPDACIVAVDACLGRQESVGVISVGCGPLLPGAGVNKQLPQVGAAFVTGTVNVGGFMEYFVLQNTRLGLVMHMAEVMAAGIRTGWQWLQREPAALPAAAGSP